MRTPPPSTAGSKGRSVIFDAAHVGASLQEKNNTNQGAGALLE
jgi:hypothetical protein